MIPQAARAFFRSFFPALETWFKSGQTLFGHNNRRSFGLGCNLAHCIMELDLYYLWQMYCNFWLARIVDDGASLPRTRSFVIIISHPGGLTYPTTLVWCAVGNGASKGDRREGTRDMTDTEIPQHHMLSISSCVVAAFFVRQEEPLVGRSAESGKHVIHDSSSPLSPSAQ